MKTLRKENTQYVNTGDPSRRAPEMEKWNTFSRPAEKGEYLPESEKMIGELNPVLENMEI